MTMRSLEVHSILDVHFHDQDRVSCFLKATPTTYSHQYGEILHFCAFTTRQLYSIGNHPEANQIAYMLQELGDPERLGVLATRGRVGDLVLGDYPGSQGRKRFETRLHMTVSKYRFHLKARGFGLLGKGIGHYVPSSITALLMYLGSRNQSDPGYLEWLARSARLLAQMHLKGNIDAKNQKDVATFCAFTDVADWNQVFDVLPWE